MIARLILTPTPLMRVFHVPESVFEVDDEPDFVLTAQRFYLVWQSGFPEYTPRIEIDGKPEESRVLQRALFRKKRIAARPTPNPPASPLPEAIAQHQPATLGEAKS